MPRTCLKQGRSSINSPALVRTLDQLCHAERRSILPRLRESTVFVSWPSADQADAVDEMILQEREHVLWLIDLINALGESPTPCSLDMRTTNINYLELNYLMPRVIQSKQSIVKVYEGSAPQVSEDPKAAALVGRILERHRAHLATLEQFGQQLKAA